MRSAGLALVAVVLTVSLQAVQQIDPAEIQLQAAINKATVEGDLKGAIIDFQKILDGAGVSRPVAARALFHLGQCHEKLGTAEARRSYERVVRDYGDQGDVVRQAQERLATLARAAAPPPEDALHGRRVIGPFNHVRVAVSRDGRYVARCCIVVHDVATGKEQEVGRAPALVAGNLAAPPAFSPDSGAIAYVAQPADEAPELRVVQRSGADDRVLLKRPDVTSIALVDWMPDGKDVLVRLAREDTSTELALVPASGGSPRTVRSPCPYTGPAGRGHLSPDGRYLAYRVQAAGGDSTWTTRLFALDGSFDAALVERPANAWNIGWTGDGRFAFYSDERGSEGIWAVEVVDGKTRGLPERVAGKVDEHTHPVGLTRGGAFFYQKQLLDFQIHLMSIAPGPGALRSVRVVRGSQAPDWSPDGRFLAYAQTGTGLVTIETLATGATKTLWTGLPGGIMALEWYPDVAGLAVQGVGPDNTMGSVGLRRLDLASGSLSDVMLGRNWREFGANPTLSADGKTLVYKAFDPARQATTLTRHHLLTGGKEILVERKPPQYVSAFAVLPGTGQIAVAFQDVDQPASNGRPPRLSGALGLLDPSSHQVHVIHRTARGEFIPAVVALAWMPDGKSLFFVTASGSGGSPMSLLRIPVSGGQPQKLFEADSIFQVRVHPDGNRLALDTRSFKFETLVVENLFGEARR